MIKPVSFDVMGTNAVNGVKNSNAACLAKDDAGIFESADKTAAAKKADCGEIDNKTGFMLLGLLLLSAGCLKIINGKY